MPRKPKSGARAGAGNTDNVNPPNDPPKDINPYEVLGIESTATTGQIRSAYLKLALKLHPDKIQSTSTNETEKATAHAKFQELAFAYSVLSDPARKARYDATGSTSDRITGEEDFFDWANFYRSQFKEVVTPAHIEEFRKKYQGSEDERDDVLKAYEDGEGDVDYLFECVMCSEEEKDLERFREMVAEAVKKGEVPRFGKFWKGDGGQRKKKRKGEEEEAKEYARKLGVYEVLFGKDGTEGAGSSGGGGGTGERKVELEGEAEVSGEDSGDEEDDEAVAEEDDGFIVDGEEDEERDGVKGEEDGEEDEEEDEAPKKAMRSKRSTRASTKAKKEDQKSSLKEELKANLSASTPPTKATRASKASQSKPETKTGPKTGPKTKQKPAASSSSTTSGKFRKEKEADSNLAGLEALIRSRQKNRFADMISNIEDRYVNKSAPQAKHVSSQSRGGKGAGRKRKVEDEDLEMVDADDGDNDGEDVVDQGPGPTDEEFEKIRARLEEGRKGGGKRRR